MLFSPEAMAMATREHKSNLSSAILTAQNFLLFEALSANQGNKSMMSGRSASISVASDAMVCVECFRMKDDQDLKAPCQNPRCYFYLRVPGCDPQRADSVSPGPIFKKMVGFDRSSGRVRPRPSQSSDFLLSQRAAGQESHSGKSSGGSGSSIWAYKPESGLNSGGYVGKMSGQSRSQSITIGSGSNAASLMRRLQSHREGSELHTSSDVQLMRNKRLLSMPLVPGMEAVLMDGGESDLVEDAFLSSPLPEFATMSERPLNPGAVGQKMVSEQFLAKQFNYST